jgi:hypothetical protein
MGKSAKMGYPQRRQYTSEIQIDNRELAYCFNASLTTGLVFASRTLL